MVERVHDGFLLVRVPLMPSYFIVESETISLRVPFDALTSRATLEAVQTLEIGETLALARRRLRPLVGASDGEALLEARWRRRLCW